MSETENKKTFSKKYIAIVIAAAIISGGLVEGLNFVGNGLTAKAGNSITVTGQARTNAIADNAVWNLNIQESSPQVATAVAKVDSSVKALSKYLTDGGIPITGIEVGGVSTNAVPQYLNGNPTG